MSLRAKRSNLTPAVGAGPTQCGTVVQNKANSGEARSTLTAVQEKDYGKIGGLRVCENKANLQGRECLVTGVLAMTGVRAGDIPVDGDAGRGYR
jgi:hypothetical protein